MTAFPTRAKVGSTNNRHCKRIWKSNERCFFVGTVMKRVLPEFGPSQMRGTGLRLHSFGAGPTTGPT